MRTLGSNAESVGMLAGGASTVLQRSLAVAIMLLGVLYAADSLWGALHRGDDGIVTAMSSTDFAPNRLIVAVRPGSAAARAKIVAGDKIDWNRTPRSTIFSARVVGQDLPYVIDHAGKARPITLHEALYRIDFWSPWKRPITAVLLVIACVLLVLRPQRATWAFLAFAWLQTITLDNQYWPYPLAIAYMWMEQIATVFMPLALLYFSVAFLAHEGRSWHRGLLWVCFTCAIGLSAAHAADVFVAVTRATRLPIAFWDAAWSYAISALTLAVLIEAYVTGRRAHRQRIAWVVSAVGFAILMQVVIPQVIPLDAYHTSVSLLSGTVYPFWVLSSVVLGLGLLYAMTQYRVIDVRFAVSRALVYAIVTGVVVALFAIVEWIAGKAFEESSAAAYAGIALALLLGFTLNALHKRVDGLVDALFFRKEHQAEAHLRHVAESILHADAEEPLAAFLVKEPLRALDLASAALFCASSDDGSLRRVSSIGWNATDLQAIAHTDELIPQLRATHVPLFLPELQWRTGEMPGGVETPLLAIPIKARGDLFGVAFYGGHANGAAINGDERGVLSVLAHNAGSAFDHIDASRTRAEMERLRLELEMFSRGGAVRI